MQTHLTRRPRSFWAVAGAASLLGWAAGAYAARADESVKVPSTGQSITLLERDAAGASEFRDGRKLPVTLPDRSRATLVVDAQGAPKALLFAPSNAIADSRQRALEAGAALNGDQSVLLPIEAAGGQRYDVRVGSDGAATVTPGRERMASR